MLYVIINAKGSIIWRVWIDEGVDGVVPCHLVPAGTTIKIAMGENHQGEKQNLNLKDFHDVQHLYYPNIILRDKKPRKKNLW
jgi:hypothetical protein